MDKHPLCSYGLLPIQVLMFPLRMAMVLVDDRRNHMLCQEAK
jgi:hypothetical protein